MYLTRMRLDTDRRGTMKGLSNPNLFHGAIEQSFHGERQHPLWRIDTLHGQLYLLILSEQIPDMSKAVEQFGDADYLPETRDYSTLLNRIKLHTRWYFRLTANPTYSKSGENGAGKRGALHAHKVPHFQKEWLEKKQAIKHGFTVNQDDFEVVSNQWFHFKKGSERNRISLLSVTYEGVLTVTDSEKFVNMLCHGIGRGKAYGMGLLTVVRVHE